MFQVPTVVEHQNHRVLTTTQLAEAYGTEPGRISENFSRNRERYTPGKHFFSLTGDELKTFKEAHPQIADNLKFAPVLTLWTEKGAWLHAKSLNTDEAWKAYEVLVDDYYRMKNDALQVHLPATYLEALEHLVVQVKRNLELEAENRMLGQRVAEYEPKASYVDQILKSKSTVTITQIAKDYGLTGHRLNAILHEEGVQYKLNDQWLLYRQHQDQGLTKSQTVDIIRTDGERTVKMNTRWTQKGRLFIHEILRRRGIVPYMDREQKEPLLLQT